jgi:hypothetical protein
MASVRERTIPTERPPPVSQLLADRGMSRGQRQRVPTAVKLCFLDRSRYLFIQVAPQLTSSHTDFDRPCRFQEAHVYKAVYSQFPTKIVYEFDVCGSVHLGNMYVLFKSNYMYYIISFFLVNASSTCFGCYLHPSSGAQLQRTAIGVCMVWYVIALEQVLIWDSFTLNL